MLEFKALNGNVWLLSHNWLLRWIHYDLFSLSSVLNYPSKNVVFFLNTIRFTQGYILFDKADSAQVVFQLFFLSLSKPVIFGGGI